MERSLYWSHLSTYEKCPQKYLWQYGWHGVDVGGGPGKPKPRPVENSAHHALMGIVIQAALEDFYNQQYWKQPNFKELLISSMKQHLRKQSARLFVDFKHISSEEIARTCLDGVLGYLKTMKAYRFVGPNCRSELRMTTRLEDIKIGGILDFHFHRDGEHFIMDGKNSKVKDTYVDPDQLRFYNMIFQKEKGHFPDRLGFIWFRYPYNEQEEETGVSWVECTTRDLQGLEERVFKVRAGQKALDFPAQPNWKTCRFCDYESVCEARQTQRKLNAAKRKKKKVTLPIAKDGFFSWDMNS